MMCHVLEAPNLFADFLTDPHYVGTEFQYEYELICEDYRYVTPLLPFGSHVYLNNQGVSTFTK